MDFVLQFWGYFFIRVDHQHPIFRSLGMSKSFLISITRPFPLDDNVRVVTADLNRSIGTERIDHDDFIAPLQAL